MAHWNRHVTHKQLHHNRPIKNSQQLCFITTWLWAIAERITLTSKKSFLSMHIQSIPFCVFNESSGADYSDHLLWRKRWVYTHHLLWQSKHASITCAPIPKHTFRVCSFIQAVCMCDCINAYMHTHVNVPGAMLLVSTVSPSVHAGTSVPGWLWEWGSMGCPAEQPAGIYWWGWN